MTLCVGKTIYNCHNRTPITIYHLISVNCVWGHCFESCDVYLDDEVACCSSTVPRKSGALFMTAEAARNGQGIESWKRRFIDEFKEIVKP